MKRTAQSFKNLKISMVGQTINFAISFLLRTIIIFKLGAGYLGLLGTFGDLFRILSLAELGFANVLLFSLYKPVAMHDDRKISAILSYFSGIYFKIGCIVAVGGAACLPILPYILTDVDNIEGIPLLYLLCLLNTSISYFYAYRKSIIVANQEAYIISKIEYTVLIIQDIAQIIAVLCFNSFVLYLVLQVISTFIQNIWTSVVAKNRYLRIKENIELSREEKHSIMQNVTALIGYRIGSVVNASTDSIVISKFVSTIVVGLYSNYLMATSALNAIINQVFDACKASLGNLNVLESEEKKYDVYRIMAYLSFWIYGLCSIGIYCFINPLFTIIWGEDYVIHGNALILIVLNFYLLGMMKNVSELFINALGLFQKVKFYPVLSALINIVLSIWLVQRYGLTGVLGGTFISFLGTYFWAWPYIVFKEGLHHKLWDYYKLYFKYSITTLISAFVCSIISARLLNGGIINLIWVGVLTFVIVCFIFLITTARTREFQYIYNVGKEMISKHLKKKTTE